MERENRDASFDMNRRRTRRFASETFNFSESDSSYNGIMGKPNQSTTADLRSSRRSRPDACEQLKSMAPEQVRELFEQMHLSDTKSREAGSNKDTKTRNKTRDNQKQASKEYDKENQETCSVGNKKDVTKTKQKSQVTQKSFVSAETKSYKLETSESDTQHKTFDVETKLLKTLSDNRNQETAADVLRSKDLKIDDKKEKEDKKKKTCSQEERKQKENCEKKLTKERETKEKAQDSDIENRVQSVKNKERVKAKSTKILKKENVILSITKSTDENPEEVPIKEQTTKKYRSKSAQGTNNADKTKVEKTNEPKAKIVTNEYVVLLKRCEEAERQANKLLKRNNATQTPSFDDKKTTTTDNSAGSEPIGPLKISATKHEKCLKKVQKSKELGVTEKPVASLTTGNKRNLGNRGETKIETDTFENSKDIDGKSTLLPKNSDKGKEKVSNVAITSSEEEEEIPRRVTRSMK